MDGCGPGARGAGRGEGGHGDHTVTWENFRVMEMPCNFIGVVFLDMLICQNT